VNLHLWYVRQRVELLNVALTADRAATCSIVSLDLDRKGLEWSVECGVWSVECGVWSVECGVWSGVEWSVRSHLTNQTQWLQLNPQVKNI
jgi:hypothetical protein